MLEPTRTHHVEECGHHFHPGSAECHERCGALHAAKTPSDDEAALVAAFDRAVGPVGHTEELMQAMRTVFLRELRARRAGGG